MVTLDGVDILHGSVPGAPGDVSPFPDVPTLDGQAYDVNSPGLTHGSSFGDGRTAFQDFSYVIDAPDTYTLEFLVADQGDNEVDSGLLVDNVELTLPPPPVGGEAYPVNKVSIILPGLALGMAVVAGSFMLLKRRSNKA